MDPTALSLLGKATKALLGGQKNGFTFRQYLAYEGMRDYQSGLDAVGIQNLLPSTSKTCERFAKRHGIKLSKVQLPDETIALRFGPNDASKTIVFFHGGGYMSPVLDQQISLAFGFSECTREDVSVLVLQYGKSPTHPQQSLDP
jgi:acetyl esterase/lipase